MLRSLEEMRGYRLGARDGGIGHVDDFYFDDCVWTIRYVVADTGGWLPGRRVLISPASTRSPSRERKHLAVDLAKHDIESGPGIASDDAVSRRMELELARHFGWEPYWEPGIAAVPGAPVKSTVVRRSVEEFVPLKACELRSFREVCDYEVRAEDGPVGKVADLIAEVPAWVVRYLVVDTGGWLSGRKVLMVPDWAEEVRWADRMLRIAMSRETIEKSPHYDPATPINRVYEHHLYDYYGRPAYW